MPPRPSPTAIHSPFWGKLASLTSAHTITQAVPGGSLTTKPPVFTPPEDRVHHTWAKRRHLPRQAARALLSATQDLTVCALEAMARLRRRDDPLARACAEIHRLRLEVARVRAENDILRARLQRIPARERPHYTPSERFAILELMKAHLLSVEPTAQRFVITAQTLYNWLKDLREEPGKKTIGSLLKPIPPLRRYQDVVRSLARRMKAAGFGGDRLIAETLASIAYKPSPTSVRRFCKEKPGPHRAPPTSAETRGRQTPLHDRGRESTVRGRYPNHLWLMDITRIPLVFPFLHLHLVVTLDAYSRMPLAWKVFHFEPSAAAMLLLLQKAGRIHGRPRHFVSDLGAQFTANAFREALRALGIRQRFGALYRHGSIALIERFWKTLKADLQLDCFWLRPWDRLDFERRLRLQLTRYAYCRPHSSLRGRVPAEVYFGIADQRPLVNLTPRGTAGAPPVECPVEIAFLDPHTRTLPILVPKAA
jgi:transposase InsO family protein